MKVMGGQGGGGAVTAQASLVLLGLLPAPAPCGPTPDCYRKSAAPGPSSLIKRSSLSPVPAFCPSRSFRGGRHAHNHLLANVVMQDIELAAFKRASDIKAQTSERTRRGKKR